MEVIRRGPFPPGSPPSVSEELSGPSGPDFLERIEMKRNANVQTEQESEQSRCGTPAEAPTKASWFQEDFARDQDPPKAAYSPQVRNWKEGEIAVGDSVFYRGERFWVESVSSFANSAHVRISDRPIDPRPGFYPEDGRSSFYVPADLCTEAPVRGRSWEKQPSVKDLERAKRTKAGATDVGDTVADMLRGKTLDEAYAIASRHLGVPETELRSKYGGLNNGQQRMNLGNRMRAWEKKYASREQLHEKNTMKGDLP